MRSRVAVISRLGRVTVSRSPFLIVVTLRKGCKIPESWTAASVRAIGRIRRHVLRTFTVDVGHNVADVIGQAPIFPGVVGHLASGTGIATPIQSPSLFRWDTDSAQRKALVVLHMLPALSCSLPKDAHCRICFHGRNTKGFSGLLRRREQGFYQLIETLGHICVTAVLLQVRCRQR